jgi:hypothetical protein
MPEWPLRNHASEAKVASMWKRFLAGLSVFAGTIWQWLWEFIRSVFYEHGSRMLTPIIGSFTTDDLFRWGPTIGFPIIGFWLFWKTKPTTQKGEPLNKQMRAPKIEICFRPGAPYEISEIIHGRVKSAVRIGIRNSGGSPLSNCRVYIESVAPPPALVGLFPALLDGGSFVLRHDDPEKRIDVAFHFDHVKQYRFSTPIGGLLSAESLNYMNETEQRAFVIKFVATECQKNEFIQAAAIADAGSGHPHGIEGESIDPLRARKLPAGYGAGHAKLIHGEARQGYGNPARPINNLA